MSTNADLVTWLWWRDLLERLGRQAWQTALPILTLVVAAQGHVDVVATVVTLVTTEVLTLAAIALKALAGVTSGPDSPLPVVILDRAASTFAATFLAFWPSDWAGLLHVDWGASLLAAGVAAVIAVGANYVTPPAAPLRAELTTR